MASGINHPRGRPVSSSSLPRSQLQNTGGQHAVNNMNHALLKINAPTRPPSFSHSNFIRLFDLSLPSLLFLFPLPPFPLSSNSLLFLFPHVLPTPYARFSSSPSLSPFFLPSSPTHAHAYTHSFTRAFLLINDLHS